jgi:hypothetical protein
MGYIKRKTNRRIKRRRRNTKKNYGGAGNKVDNVNYLEISADLKRQAEIRQQQTNQKRQLYLDIIKAYTDIINNIDKQMNDEGLKPNDLKKLQEEKIKNIEYMENIRIKLQSL